MKTEPNPDRIVEVVMKKEMSFSEYQNMKNQAESKGWKVQAYQVGFYQDKLKKTI